jgi:hypothetical protein
MKSHVSMAQHQCPICGVMHDTGEILLNKNLRQTLDPKTTTGMSFCPQHAKMRDEGYIALIECDPNGVRLGRVAHIRATVWPNIFDAPVPTGGAAFVMAEVMDMLEKIPVEGEVPGTETKN